MKGLVVVVAAFGLPLVALAQSADGPKATELSGLTVTVHRSTTDLSGLDLTGRCAPPANSRWPNALFDAAPASAKVRAAESPGTRDFILREIDDLRQGTNDYGHMGRGLALAAQHQLPLTTRWIGCRGAFKAISFLHVTKAGADDFEVQFENGALEWEVAPLDAVQTTRQSAIRYFYPQPATRQLEDLLESMQRGWPNYRDLTRDLASTLKAQGPALQQAFRDWGSLKQLYFLRHGDDGAYIYVASFERRRVVWTVAPLGAGGKLAGLTYEETAGS
jgi:hypothetical protein